jgi:hypothetical protein
MVPPSRVSESTGPGFGVRGHNLTAKEQAQLRGWLDKIVRFKKLSKMARTRLLTEIAGWANETKFTTEWEVRHGRAYCVHITELPISDRSIIGEALLYFPQLQYSPEDDPLRVGDLDKCKMCDELFVMSRGGRVRQEFCSRRCKDKYAKK